MTPKRLAQELYPLLTDGSPSLSFADIGRRLSLRQWEIRTDIRNAQKFLLRDGILTMLVTDFYFTLGREPRKPEDAIKCCAQRFRRAAGIRIMFKKEDDLMGVTWLGLNLEPARGRLSHNAARVGLAHSIGNLSAGVAKDLVDQMFRLELPYYETEFATLMGTPNGTLGNGS